MGDTIGLAIYLFANSYFVGFTEATWQMLLVNKALVDYINDVEDCYADNMQENLGLSLRYFCFHLYFKYIVDRNRSNDVSFVRNKLNLGYYAIGRSSL